MKNAQYYLDNPDKIIPELFENNVSQFSRFSDPHQYSSKQLNQLFDSFLDETWGETMLCGNPYKTSQVLKEVDPDFRREVFLNWFDQEFIEIEIYKSLPVVYRRESFLSLLEMMCRVVSP